MADSVLPVLFNKGLDTVTPPLLAEAGSLVDCHNYELTDIIGYRRIDGWENYDGWPNGDVTAFFRIDITADVPAEQSDIIAGSVLFRSDNGLNPVAIGVVVGGSFPTNLYDIVPFRNSESFILTEDFLLYEGDAAFVQLQSGEGLLKILGGPSTLGSLFTIVTPSGATINVSTGTNLIEGGILMDAATYLTTLRTYSANMRALVQEAPAPIAGIFWFENRLYAAVNTPSITFTAPVAGGTLLEGMLLRYNGKVYRIVKLNRTTIGSDYEFTAYLQFVRLTTGGEPVDTSLDEIQPDGTLIKEWLASTSLTSTDNSVVAALGYFNNPDISTMRGFTYLPSATNVVFDTGSNSPALGPSRTFDDSTFYYAVGPAGSVLKVRLVSVTQTGGDFTAGSATGSAQLVVEEVIAGTVDYIKDTAVIHKVYPTTGTSAVFTVTEVPTMSYLAGTYALDQNESRYQWQVGNFFANSDTLAMYGTTGAGYAFWGTKYGYGNIFTGLSVDLDKPKYLALHVSKLALGYARGSVLLSVMGEPHNFQGVAGAIEVATGDNITGLIEMPGETLAVFGKRSIRKITGYTETDTVLGTISANTGCLDYTAVLIGQDAVYTGVHGITTLQQTASYGDFTGQRLSDKISNWLRPKLIAGYRSLEQGGVVCAYPVRYKNQYRLVLASGKIVVVTLTSEGPKISWANHGLSGELNIPYAWSSEISTTGKERVHVVWNRQPRSKQCVELESGWGFNGKTFSHFFDLTHWFNNNGSQMGGIEKVRLYGQGYGVATLNVKSSGVEKDFNQPYHSTIQDISMPANIETLYSALKPVTSIIDQRNWGLGIKLQIAGTTSENTDQTEPPHICQAAVLHLRTEGAIDS